MNSTYGILWNATTQWNRFEWSSLYQMILQKRGSMAKLYELAKVIRSKNAGALLLTLDIMFDNEEAYRTVFDSGVLSPRKIASLYNLSDNQVEIIAFEVALAIKITIPRHTTAGSPGDSDVYGAQQHAPLLDLEITSG